MKIYEELKKQNKPETEFWLDKENDDILLMCTDNKYPRDKSEGWLVLTINKEGLHLKAGTIDKDTVDFELDDKQRIKLLD